MPKINKLFQKVPIEVNNKSSFDMSFENMFTATCGTITPVVSEFLLPGDTISLGFSGQVQLPPAVSDFYGKVSAKLEAFFVPARLLYGGFQRMMTHDDNPYDVDGEKVYPVVLPPFLLGVGGVVDGVKFPGELSAGSLGDYLGISPRPIYTSSDQDVNIVVPNILKFMAYHKIYDDWYRDSRIQKPVFDPRKNFEPIIRTTESSSPDYNKYSVSRIPQFTLTTDRLKNYRYQYVNDSVYTDPLEPDSFFPIVFDTKFDDGHQLTALRQRNWTRDYFTNATALPQAGNSQKVSFEISDDSGSFSIASLRAANSLQQWLERNQLAGFRYGDQIKARFGIYPDDAILQRSIYLGSSSFDIYNKSVYQQSPSDVESANPFSSVGAKYGSPLGVGKNSLVDKFTAKEYGYLFVNFTLVPYATYNGGTRRDFSWSQASDFPDPMLAGVGDQDIFAFELEHYVSASRDYQLRQHNYINSNIGDPTVNLTTFGYTQRFADSKFINDQVHGLLKDGESLQQFALQRSFGDGNQLGTEFIQIPKDFMDQVFSVANSVSKFGCWADFYFKFVKTTTLPAYSLPTLGDPRNTHTEVVDNGGRRL